MFNQKKSFDHENQRRLVVKHSLRTENFYFPMVLDECDFRLCMSFFLFFKLFFSILPKSNTKKIVVVCKNQ